MILVKAMERRATVLALLVSWLVLPAVAPRVWAQRPVAAFVAQHCSACHADNEPAAQLDLVRMAEAAPPANASLWERVVRKLQTHQMPPEGEPQPDRGQVEQVLDLITQQLDEAYRESPAIPSTPSLRRLTRTEYQYAVRDLLDVEVDATTLLPPDESSHGFDNITVGDLSPAFLNRAISAAEKISHWAIGGSARGPGGETYRIKPDVTQEEHVPGLPIGTRGGTLIRVHFPREGEYEVTVRLTRDRNEEVEGLHEPHELELTVDRARIALFTVQPPPGRKDFSKVDAHLHARVTVAAGGHDVGVTFLKKPSSLLETKRQPYNAHYNMHRHPRLSPAVYEVSITGPFQSQDLAQRSESHLDGHQVAEEQLRRLTRLALRRPVAAEDLEEPLAQFSLGAKNGGYRAGMERAIAAILVSPNFLFKVEPTPSGLPSGSSYPIGDLELASRLSFFLWSSLPDDALLSLAEQGRLREPDVLEEQVERMLRDRRSQSLVDNFAEQWLYLRNLDSITPDLRLFPDFDDNLRQAMRQETKLLFESVLRRDRSVLDLLRSESTFLNERLAKHYGIDHVYGSRFREVQLDSASHRGGLLRHGSILTVTSYATRTSPVNRGHWILKNVVGSPPPPPPADVPALKDNTVSATLSMRARLAEHRAHQACAVCHNVMDPVGFALENFDAVGRWRELEDGQPIDASGGLAGQPPFQGVEGLEIALLEQGELFVSTIAEKLLTYALGRGIEPSDGPAIRDIVRRAEADDYRFSAILQAIVSSPPFQSRSVP